MSLILKNKKKKFWQIFHSLALSWLALGARQHIHATHPAVLLYEVLCFHSDTKQLDWYLIVYGWYCQGSIKFNLFKRQCCALHYAILPMQHCELVISLRKMFRSFQ